MQITPPLNALFKSSQGVNIDVGYIIDEQDTGEYILYEAAELSFSVYGFGTVLSTSKITVVLINRWFQNEAMIHQQVIIKSLGLSEEFEDLVAFAAIVPDTPLARSINPGNLITVVKPQIAVVIDGVWQQDPLQWPGAHNFNFTWKVPSTTP